MSDSDKPRPAATAAFAAKPDDGKRTPEEWAAQFGQRRAKTFEETVSTVNGKPFDVVGSFLDKHAAAAVLHFWGRSDEPGWGHLHHHPGQPIRLSRADYEAALKAAGVTNKQGEYVPHKSALSPHAPKSEPKTELPEEEE